jgi:acyl-homoserine-lactone acylase
MMRRIFAALCLVLFAGLAGTALFAVWPERAVFDGEPFLRAALRYEVEIRRDAFGVPHVYGERDVDVAYGLAFAHAEDDFPTMQSVLLATRGQLARFEGMEAAPIDYLVHLMGFWEHVEARYERDLSPEARAVAEAFADGVNHYAALHPDAVRPGLLPVTGRDVVAGFAFKMPFFFGFERVVMRLFEGEPLGAGGTAPAETAFRFLAGPRAVLGSNAVAVAPSRSADGATRLLVNSHQPFEGPVAWYEVRLVSGEGWDVAGGVFPGSPVMLHGHNRNLGWASTVNRPDLVDVYRLEIHPEDENRYRLDGAWRELEVSQVTLSVRIFGRLRWNARREVLRSAHGPVLRLSHGTYALRWAGMEEVRHLDQYLRMNKARDFAEWRAAMEMQALPSVNFVYADRQGNIAYFYNARFPRRAEGVDWEGVVPGDRSELIWTEHLPFSAVPQVVNPRAGFVLNANHTPFRTTAEDEDPRPEDFSPALGIERDMTNRAHRAFELYGEDPAIGAEAFRRYKFDKRYSEQSEVRRLVDAILAAGLEDDPELGEAVRVLSSWRMTAEVDDTGTALAVLTLSPIILARREGREPPDLVASLREAAAALRRHHGRLDPPWGQVNRFRRGHIDEPVGGGPDVLRAIESFVLEDDGTYTARSGDCFFLFVEWDAEGRLRSESIHQYGSATLDERSPHYADQVPLFLAEEMKPVHLEEEALLAHATRIYRPGEEEAEGPPRTAGRARESAR